jgi:hypothetical protein
LTVAVRERAQETTLMEKMTAAKPTPIQNTGGMARNPTGRGRRGHVWPAAFNSLRTGRNWPIKGRT